MFLIIMTEPLEDPYLMDEEDPAQCCALESSLWEIKVCTVCDVEWMIHDTDYNWGNII